jgi:Rad3-related DNA helicase
MAETERNTAMPIAPIASMEQPTTDIMSYFPLAQPRKTQEKVIREVDKLFKSGKRIVILRAPVGSGKSAIAMTLAKSFSDAHILTPRKSLQDQYFEDFEDDIVLMKGRSAYPCTNTWPVHQYKKVIASVNNGKVRPPPKGELSCADGACKNSKDEWKMCVYGTTELKGVNTANERPCPYTVATQLAMKHPIVVHNVHSFIFQASLMSRFEKRELIVVDEAHETADIVRGFIGKSFSIKAVVEEDVLPPVGSTVKDWCNFFLRAAFVPVDSPRDAEKRIADATYMSSRDRYFASVNDLLKKEDSYGKTGFSVRHSTIYAGTKAVGTSFEFVPHSVGDAVNRLILDYGERVLLMSGTIYDHKAYCSEIGVNPSEAVSIEIPSNFPVSNRPIYIKPEYQVNTSFATWKQSFEEMTAIISKIMGIFHDVKGLIQTPSYEASSELITFLKSKRLVTHNRFDFQDKLEEFYASSSPNVFVSPVCQQGVDFKDDRARFQIILRVPYPNTSDPFMGHMVKSNFGWYNNQALVTFGQQTGRINRNDKDFGATFLLDSRFNNFLARNTGKLPKWLKNAFIFK